MASVHLNEGAEVELTLSLAEAQFLYAVALADQSDFLDSLYSGLYDVMDGLGYGLEDGDNTFTDAWRTIVRDRLDLG